MQATCPGCLRSRSCTAPSLCEPPGTEATPASTLSLGPQRGQHGTLPKPEVTARETQTPAIDRGGRPACLEFQGGALRVDPGADDFGHYHAQVAYGRQAAVEATFHTCHHAGQQLCKHQTCTLRPPRPPRAEVYPCHLLTILAVSQLWLPQVRQADEDGCTDVALLCQGRMADGTAAAPCLQQLLQHLAGNIAPAWSGSCSAMAQDHTDPCQFVTKHPQPLPGL
jgi:hypothetical protein